MAKHRVEWIDVAKGVCIILVVMLHATVSWVDMTGRDSWMSAVSEFALPFRMPAFFMVSGLFLSRSIDAPLLEYVDRKVLHFVYFYLLWLVIHLAVLEGDTLVTNPDWFWQMVVWSLTDYPYETLWFVHMLAIFYIVARLVRRAPKALILAAAVGLHIYIYSGGGELRDSYVWHEFPRRFVFFFFGYAAAPYVFGFVNAAVRHWGLTLVLLGAWVFANQVMIDAGMARTPGVNLLMGLAGAGAVFAVSALLTQAHLAAPLSYAGANSIVIYLTEIIPTRIVQKLWLWLGPVPDIGWASLITTIITVVSSLAFHRMIRDTPLNFLYVRPKLFRLSPKPRQAEAP